jgi:ABC-type phosphate transport system auxiliary subunit
MSELIQRLRGYNPPDRTIDEQRQIAVDLREAADEIERLRAENARLSLNAAIDKQALDSLRAENEELRKDAGRYRWLRDVGDETWIPLGKRPNVRFTHEIDAAIDKARKT